MSAAPIDAMESEEVFEASIQCSETMSSSFLKTSCLIFIFYTIASTTRPHGHKSPMFVVNRIRSFIFFLSESEIRSFYTSLLSTLSSPSFALDS